MVRALAVLGATLVLTLVPPPPAPAQVPTPPPAPPSAIGLLRIEMFTLPPERERSPLPLSLKESILLALQQNYDIAIQKLGPGIAATDIQKELGAFDPTGTGKIANPRTTVQETADFFANKNATEETLKGTAEVTKKFLTGSALTLTYETTDKRDPASSVRADANVALKISQSLLKNFGFSVNEAKIRIARKNTAEAQTDFIKKVLDVATEVQNAYWDLYRARQTLNVRREAFTTAKGFLERKQAEVDLGVIAPIELVDVQADLAGKVTDYLEAVKALEEADVRLRAVLNLPFDFPLDLQLTDDPAPGDYMSDFRQSMETAFTYRPEYQKLKLAADVKRLELDFARNQLLPDLELSLTLKSDNKSRGWNDSYAWWPFDPKEKERYERWGYELGFKLTYPLGNNVARADYVRKQLELSRSRLELKQEEVTLKKEIANALNALDSIKQLLASSENALKLQQANLDAAQQRLQFGVGTIREVLDIKTSYTDARLKNLGFKTDYQKSLATLYRAQGIVDSRLDIELLREYLKYPQP